MNISPSLGIVTPMANEIHTAREFVDAVLVAASIFEFREVSMFPVFDTVCQDGTREMMEQHAKTDSRIKVIYAPENRSVVDAYMQGYRKALDSGCDWILEIDAGFSHDPNSIPEFLEKISSNVDVVYATRFTLGGEIINSSVCRRFISRFGSLISNVLLGTKLGDMTSGFILYSRHALESVLAQGIQSRGPFFQTEMKYHARDLPYAEVPIVYQGASHVIGKRAINDAKYHLRRLVRDRFSRR
ncbi:MAG: glycosyltransferase [Verrucomicrobiota bacterium]